MAGVRWSAFGWVAASGLLLATVLGLPRAEARRESTSPDQATWTSLFPASIEGLRRCDEFDATVEGWGLSDVIAFELEVGFDPAVLEFSTASVAPWMAERWSGYTEFPPVIGQDSVLFAAAADQGAGSASGDGEMAVVRFRAIGPGTSTLDLRGVRLYSSVGGVTEVTSTDATAMVLNEDGPGCVPTPTYTPEPSPTDEPSPTNEPPVTGVPTETATRTGTPNGTPVATPTASATPSEAATEASATATATDESTPGPTETKTPTWTAGSPSATLTLTPTRQPTASTTPELREIYLPAASTVGRASGRR